MDSLTQLALGAVVAAVCVAPAQRRRALAYGAALGTVPDLDVLLPWPDPVSAMVLHRSFSHSLLVLTVLAPLLYLLLARLDPVLRLESHRWRLAFWLALLTHPLLDALTTYGTQLLWPLDRTPYAVGSVFIIDPLYTLPLVLATLGLLWRPRAGRWAGTLLAMSTLYLGWGLLAQYWVSQRADRDVGLAGLGTPVHLQVSPAPFNTLLWRVVARTPDGRYAEAWHSLWSESAVTDWQVHAGLPDPPDHLPALQRLRAFNGGTYALREVDGVLWYADLRMGSHPWYAFRFALAERVGTAWRPIPVQQAPMARPPLSVIPWLWTRLFQPDVARPGAAQVADWSPAHAVMRAATQSPVGGAGAGPAPPPPP